MIELNYLGDGMTQILGSHNGVSVSGLVYRTKTGPILYGRYNIKLIKHPILLKVFNYGIPTNEQQFIKRIEDIIKNTPEFQK